MFKGKRFSLKGNFLMMFGISFGISVTALMLLSLIFAFIANASKDSTGNLELFSLVSLLIGGAVGGFGSAKINKEAAVIFSALVALSVSLIMLITCLIMNGKIGGGAMMNYACYIGTSTFAGFVASGERKHKRHRR